MKHARVWALSKRTLWANTIAMVAHTLPCPAALVRKLSDGEQWPLKRLTSVLHQVTTLQIQHRRQTFLHLDLPAHYSARIKILT